MTKIHITFKELIKITIIGDPNIGHYYSKKHPNTKYTLNNILEDILYVLKTGISWRNIRSSINWKSTYFHFQRFVKHNIFKKFYLQLRSLYFTNNKTNIQIIDSSFIMNKFGRNKVARNAFLK